MTKLLQLVLLGALLLAANAAEPKEPIVQWEYAQLIFNPNGLPGLKINPAATAYVFKSGTTEIKSDTTEELVNKIVEEAAATAVPKDVLNALGSLGWELVAVDSQPKSQLTICYFKRQKQP
jgi:hypothetical protein